MDPLNSWVYIVIFISGRDIDPTGAYGPFPTETICHTDTKRRLMEMPFFQHLGLCMTVGDAMIKYPEGLSWL